MYLFFDTETSGLPKDYKAPISDSNNWPRLVQIAWSAADKNKITFAEESFIIKPVGFTIPENVANIHGITTEKAMDEGKDLKETLEHFISFIVDADIVIGHNINFDKKIIYAEFYRNNMQDSIEALHSKNKICTMFKSTKHCKLPKPSGRGGYKWPKLEELHKVLFNKGFEGAHDALVDIQATVKCFWKLLELNVIELPDMSEDKGFGNQSWGN